ncbi:MAG: diaminopimelate decarboxylase [Ethanoligenens sp.]|uniref:diaminopimelate decarboxylase n=1 Tax=Ethanoligenens sp. TaxID=2099655 RepID=UPI0039E8FD76
MFVSDCLNVNQQGHLTIGGCDTLELAAAFGTPLYVMDEATIVNNCRKYVDSIKTYYNGNGRVYYASKAFCCKEICRIMENEQMGLDVVSAGEIYTAMSTGFPAERLCFHGNNKTSAEINYALDCGVGRFMVDNLTELALLNRLALERNKKAVVLLRIKPGIDAHTHNFIRTGQIDSKFGLALETGEAEEAIKEAITMAGINLTGIHCHIGSQIFDLAPFELAAEVMVNFMADMRDRHGAKFTELNLGGGFGIKYVPEQDPVPYDRYMEAVSETVKKTCLARDMDTPFIMLEPGRSIVASAGITLYTVGAVKEIPGIRTYVSIDGGMGDNPRYALYQAEYAAVVADRAAEKPTATVTIAGKCCESGDLIQEHTAIQPAEAGNILAVFATGAYNYSMASNYNRIPRPAAVMIRDQEPRVIIKRETFDDLVHNDV